ncbi:MAG: hypothetical protein Q7S50_03465 [bacterium]|nr:hypothetical protein [bacterium]
MWSCFAAGIPTGIGKEEPEILGAAAQNPAVQESARRLRSRYRAATDMLLERLLVDGAEQRITIEDIEQLASLEKTPDGKSPEFMRKIIIELMVCLRKK